MERTLGSLLAQRHFASGRMAFVVGPRQVGKTTLARRLLDERGTADLYRNWDDLGWRRSVGRDPYGFIGAYRPKSEPGTEKPLAALDEIYRFPGWKRYLKALRDAQMPMVDQRYHACHQQYQSQRVREGVVRAVPRATEGIASPNSMIIATSDEIVSLGSPPYVSVCAPGSASGACLGRGASASGMILSGLTSIPGEDRGVFPHRPKPSGSSPPHSGVTFLSAMTSRPTACVPKSSGVCPTLDG